MARPHKQTVDYFPHYADARNGDTLTVLQARFGNDGYAFWFKLLEKLASSEGHFIDLNDPARWQLFLARSGVNELSGVEILNLLLEMKAIDSELWSTNRIIWCQNLVDNVAEAYRNRKRPVPTRPLSTPHNLLTTPNNSITTPDNTQTKLNDTILDETKEEGCLSIEDVYEVYKKELGADSLSEDTENEIELAVKRFTAPWVIDAIREAVKRKRKDWRYIAGILKNWERYGKDADIPQKSYVAKGGRRLVPKGTYDNILAEHQRRVTERFNSEPLQSKDRVKEEHGEPKDIK
jgi:DnaD/phage-associated family protein